MRAASAAILWSLALTAGCDAVFELDRPDAPPADGDPIDAPPQCPSSFGGRRHLYVEQSVLWSEARTTCVSLDRVAGDDTHTHLAVITDSAELESVTLPSATQVWVGLIDLDGGQPGAFAWVTAESPPLVPWNTGEPDSPDQPRCGYAYTNTAKVGVIGDAGCEITPRPFLCECDQFPDLSAP